MSNRINNGMPDFGPMSPVTVDPRSAPAKTPYQPVKVVNQNNLNYFVGTPNVTVPPSQPSQAVKQSR